MAEKTPEKKVAKRTKRKFRAAPTLRQQAELRATGKSNKPSRIKRIFGSKILKPIWAPFILIGRGLKKIYNVRILTPLRFIVRMTGYVVVPVYFRNSWKELKYVTWPSASMTMRLTGAVLIFGVAFGLLIAGLDFVLEKLFREVLLG